MFPSFVSPLVLFCFRHRFCHLCRLDPSEFMTVTTFFPILAVVPRAFDRSRTFSCVSLSTMCAFTPFFGFNVQSLRLLSPVCASLAHFALIFRSCSYPLSPYLSGVSAHFIQLRLIFTVTFMTLTSTFLLCTSPFLAADPWHIKYEHFLRIYTPLKGIHGLALAFCIIYSCFPSFLFAISTSFPR